MIRISRKNRNVSPLGDEMSSFEEIPACPELAVHSSIKSLKSLNFVANSRASDPNE